MFSGFRYIFGYSDETVAQGVSQGSTAPALDENNDVTPTQRTTSIESSTNRLEQTLNAATTKFTEQLLPQQASIEELQSSSHQLLPSIVEQHEEDESKRKVSACENVVDIDGEDDADGFNDESWELLDLVEKAEDALASASLASSVQGHETTPQGLTKSTSGILKSQSTCEAKEQRVSQRRRKPKVSFDSLELVKSKQEIEQTMSNETLAQGSGKIEEGQNSKSLSDVDCKKVPILNYAKALSKKLETESVQARELKHEQSSSKTITEGFSDALAPVKRGRPTRLSTSSWSSHDEEDNIEQIENADWEISGAKPADDALDVRGQVQGVDDDESIISSGFSDCDYGFGGINDYVVRPKKTNAKRGRTISAGPSSINRMKSNRPERKVITAKAKLTSAAVAAAEAKIEVKSSGTRDLKPELHKNSKPKKKRMSMTSSKSVSLSDFLKNRSGSNKEAIAQDAALSQQVPPKPTGGGSTESSDIAEMDESWFVTPPPCFTRASKMDSSEKVGLLGAKDDDQENALIEHPSVYIGNAASKNLVRTYNVAAKSKPAGLIKAESVSPKPGPTGGSLVALEDEIWNSDGDNVESDNSKFVSGEKVVKFDEKNGSSGDEKVMDVVASFRPVTKPTGKKTALTTATSSAVQVVGKKPSKAEKGKAQMQSTTAFLGSPGDKAWKNKFIVDVWDLDDNDDVDSDFDNMFEPSKKRKSTKTKKQQQKQAKVKETSGSVTSSRSAEIADFDYSSSSSVELLSVKSLSQSEFQNSESLEPSIGFDGDQQQVLDQCKQVASPVPKGNVEHRRPPIQVRPLEPERVPSWKLKRQRSKRRPLAPVSIVNRQQLQQLAPGATKTPKVKGESPASVNSSRGSTPTLIDRIGCSIVANLTNLTSGLVSSGAMNYCSPSGQATMVESQERAVVSKSNFSSSTSQVARKQLSRGSIRRQNICAKQGNTLRRPGRRLKLFATPNGYSINRKVHTSIH